MIAQRLLDELEQLNRDEKLQVVRFLNEELSDDIKQYLGDKRAFKVPSRFIASDGGAAMRRVLEDEQAQID